MTIESTLTDWDAGARQCVIEADQLFPGFSWGTYNGHDPSKGLAADAMVPAWQTAAGRAKGQELADWIWTNRARWGIWYLIFDGRIISQTRPEQGWIRYFDADSPNPSRSHKNHVHMSWRSAPAIPVVWIDRLVPGVTDSDSVRVVQRALGVPSDGTYGPSTVAAATAFQRSLGDAAEHCDGVLGPRQTVALLLRAGVRATVRTDPSGSPAPTPVEPVPVPTDPVPSPPTYPAPTARDVYLDRLHEGVNDSDSVWWVQSALTRLNHYTGPLDGTYGPATLTAVKRYQLVLGDDPKHCDGLLGEKQTIRLFTDAAMPVTIWRSSVSGGQLWPAPDPTPTPPKDPDPMPKPATVTIVSANVLRRTDPDRARKTWAQRVGDIVTHIRSGSPTVVLLQEVDSVTAADIFGRLGPSWHYDRCRGLAVGWYSPDLERVGDAQCALYPDKENRYRHSVPLRHRVTGATFWADCTHLENDGDTGTDGHRARHVEISAFVTGTKTGKRVFGADLNSTTSAASSATARQREKPRPQLRAAGWWLLSEQADVKDRALESHHGGKTRNGKTGPWIDDAGGKGVAYVKGSGRLIRTDQTDASDHHFLRFQVQI